LCQYAYLFIGLTNKNICQVVLTDKEVDFVTINLELIWKSTHLHIC